MARIAKLRVKVAVDEYDHVIVAVYNIAADGYATCVRESVFDVSSALQLAYELQQASEFIMKRRADELEKVHGRKTQQTAIGRH